MRGGEDCGPARHPGCGAVSLLGLGSLPATGHTSGGGTRTHGLQLLSGKIHQALQTVSGSLCAASFCLPTQGASEDQGFMDSSRAEPHIPEDRKSAAPNSQLTRWPVANVEERCLGRTVPWGDPYSQMCDILETVASGSFFGYLGT